MVKAILKNYRQSPRKVRLVANTIRGQKVDKAIMNLSFVAKRSALPIQKLIESAAANATNNFNLDADSLFIKSIQVDQGFTMKRWIPKWRGTAHPIRKKTCKVTVVVDGSSAASSKAVKTDSK